MNLDIKLGSCGMCLLLQMSGARPWHVSSTACRDAASVLGVLEADSNSCVCQGEIQVAELHSRNVYVWYKLTIKVVQAP